MNDTHEPKSDRMRRRSDYERLNSWKAIANYFNRSVRTVRRWETDEGLPVHRHKHGRGSSVYAHVAELNAWQAEQLAPSSPIKPAQGHERIQSTAFTRRSKVALAIPAGVVAIVVAIVGILLFNGRGGPLDLEPGDRNIAAAQSILESCLERVGTDSCVYEHVQYARLRVEDFDANYHAALALLSRDAEVFESTVYARRALAAIRQPGSGSFSPEHIVLPENIAITLSIPMISAWSSGDVKAALAHSRELRATMNDYPLAVRRHLQPRLVNFALTLGRIDESRTIGEAIPDADQQFEATAGVLFAAGDMRNLKRHLSFDQHRISPSIALFSAMTGLINADDESQIDSLSNPQRAVLKAMMKTRNGEVSAAVHLLQESVVDLAMPDQGYFFVGQDMLAKLLHKQGELASAIRVLEQTTANPAEALLNNSGLYWMMCQKQLASLYRAADREYDAMLIEDRLRGLLTEADEHFPLAADLLAT